MTKEQTFGPKEPQGIGIKGIKMGSRRSTTRQPSSAPIPLYLPHCFRLFPSTSSPLPPLNPSQPAPQSVSPLNYQQLPLNPFQLVQKSVPQLDSQQLSPNPLSSPFQLAQKCAPTSPQVQNPALKCARPFLNGFKMRAACAPRCANFPKNPIFSPKTQKTAIFDNTSRQTPLENPAPHDVPAPKPPTPLIPLLSGDNDDSSAPESPAPESPVPAPSPCSNHSRRLN